MPSRMSYVASRVAAGEAETPAGCWPWPKVDRNGYPTSVKVDGRVVMAHVAVYLREVGPVPEGLTLDHLCHTSSGCVGGTTCEHRRCVRPDHLEPVTPQEQRQRTSRFRQNTCANGHEYTETNTLWVESPRGRYRQCRTCNGARHQRRKLEQAPGIYVAGEGYVRSGS